MLLLQPTVFCTSWFAAPQHVVKIVEPPTRRDRDAKSESDSESYPDPDSDSYSEEAAICELLQPPGASDVSSGAATDNHAIPCDVVRAEKTVLVMPYLPSMKAPSATLSGRLWLESFLELAYQLIEVLTSSYRRAGALGTLFGSLHAR